jgi:HAD superfamily hydrolase (TIGR01457 family)
MMTGSGAPGAGAVDGTAAARVAAARVAAAGATATAGGATAGRPLAPLAGCPQPLADRFDVALLDLDGVVYRGASAVPSAAEAIEAAAGRGMRAAFVTNNALRTPEAVAARLTGFGVPASPGQVVTSAQVAARVLAGRLPGGARVLVLGGDGLHTAIRSEGLVPVTISDDDPAAVVVGFDPQLTYARLAEAALAIRAGALWVASNADATVPAERGLLPGNGAALAFLRTATGAEPLITGKPELAMHAESVRRSGARRPLIVGDRLDTDVEAGCRAACPTLLVLTGVTAASDLLVAPAPHRPTYLAHDLCGLLRPQRGARVDVRGDGTAGADGTVAVCGSWACEIRAGTLHWQPARTPAQTPARHTPDRPRPPGSGTRPGGDDSAGLGRGSADAGGADDGLDAVRAACACAWAAADAGTPVRRLARWRPPGCEDLTLPDAGRTPG